MKNVIITGATGMIGSTLTSLLIEKNFNVYAIIRPNSKKVKNIPQSPNVNIIECDLSKLEEIQNKLPKCDIFFHFGWEGVESTKREDVNIQLKNVKNTIKAINLAKKVGCEVFVGAGSQAEYGIKSTKLSPETSINPLNCYGIAKYSAEQFSKKLCNQLDIKFVWGRILSVYGPKDNPYSLIISYINAILNNQLFDTTKGEQEWDYLFSEDCAEAFYLMATKGVDGEIYTVGSGKSKPLKNYLVEIRDIINENYEIKFGNIPYSKNQVMYLCADIDKLTKDTGFIPKTSFNEGIKKTIEWCKILNK